MARHPKDLLVGKWWILYQMEVEEEEEEEEEDGGRGA